MADGGVGIDAVDFRVISDALRVSKRAVEMRAKKDGWHFHEVTGVGGRRRLIALDSVPQDVRKAVLRQRALDAAAALPASPAESAGRQVGRKLAIAEAVDTAVDQRARERGQIAAAGLTGRARERMDAKLELLARLGTFAQARGIGTCAAMDEFCDAYNSGAPIVEVWVRNFTGADLHPATLRRWKRIVRDKGPRGLAGEYGNRKGSSRIDGDDTLRKFILGVLTEKPHISVTVMHAAIRARLPERLPNLKALERWLKAWKADNAELFTAVTNPDAWKNKFMPAFGDASENIVRANQLWMADTTPADLQLVDGRHCVLGVIDVARRKFRMYVSKTSTAEAVCQLYRRNILEFGVPEAIKMDNGSDYASERVAALLTSLHIEPKFSAPFAPWEKPHIERAFKTFSHDLLEILPGYSGHNVADAQAIRARTSFAENLFKKGGTVELKLTAAELQDFCDRWVDNVYDHNPHEGLDGLTPFQKSAQMRDTLRVIGDERALDLLLGAGDMRTVGKKGLRLEKLTYIAPELATVIGQPVLVRRDEADIGRAVVYHREQFLCIAECPEVTGVSMREIASESRARKSKLISQQKAELKALGRKANTSELARDILDSRARDNASLAAFPQDNVLHITPALEAAAEAADALAAHGSEQAPVYDPADPMYDVGALIGRERDAEGDDTYKGRFARALRAMRDPGNEIVQQWLKGYRQSSEFAGSWLMFESFGASHFGLEDSFNELLPEDAIYRINEGG